MSARVWLAALVGVVLMTPTAGKSLDCLSMKVTPRQAFAPVNLKVSVSIEPDASNRALTVVADSYDFYRSSEIPLEGNRAPHIVTVEFRNLPGGEYQVTGTLLDAGGKSRGVVTQAARVLSLSADR